MDLTRTRRALAADLTEDYRHASQLLDALDIVYEDAEEALEDQMRRYQNSITTSDVESFLERSVEYLTKKLLEVSSTETILALIAKEDVDGYEAALGKMTAQLSAEKEQRAKWGNDESLGDLDDHCCLSQFRSHFEP